MHQYVTNKGLDSNTTIPRLINIGVRTHAHECNPTQAHGRTHAQPNPDPTLARNGATLGPKLDASEGRGDTHPGPYPHPSPRQTRGQLRHRATSCAAALGREPLQAAAEKQGRDG